MCKVFFFDALHGYAFIVEGLEYGNITLQLSFKTTIDVENAIPYSKEFLNKRGVGSMFTRTFSEYSDVYNIDIIAMREHLGFENVCPYNFNEIVEGNKANAEEIIENELFNTGATNIRDLSTEYTYSLFDIEYEKDGIKRMHYH